MRPRPTLSRSLVLERSWPVLIDLGVLAAGLAVFFALFKVAHYWMGQPMPAVEISESVRALPAYAFYSTVRIFVAYLLSLAFAIAYGYLAAYNARLEPVMVAVLDILQSIPVLSFLPGVMLAMMALIPTRQLGIEFGAILLIFTGQVWNMAFSFYSSLKSIPRELVEAARIYRYSAWQRFWQLELPNAAIGLIWNSMVSVAGGWFFLMACEMFVLRDRDFRLPGLGSYLQTAASNGDTGALLAGLAAMVLIIVAIDQLVWRPLIVWSDRFKNELTESASRGESPVLDLLQRSSFLAALEAHTVGPVSERIYARLARRPGARKLQPLDAPAGRRRAAWLTLLLAALAAGVVLYAAFHAALLLRGLNGHELLRLLGGAGATFLRVNFALLLAAAWTIPAGVAIGFEPRLARVAQPLVQVLASIPAPAFFPLILLFLLRIHLGLGVGSILLMLLGTQWYILFNVIAGAMAIPTDLKEAASLFRFSSWQRWRTLILPGIFPYLLTGLITASGGAWNASIIAEYFRLKDRTLEVRGLGAEISAATDGGSFAVLLVATVIMALMVVTINRLLWRRLYHLAETRYRLEG